MKIKQLAEDMGFEVLHGIVDCLWVVGEPIAGFKEAVERETGILTEVDSYDWIAFMPMADGMGAYNRYTGIYIPLQNENKKRAEAYQFPSVKYWSVVKPSNWFTILFVSPYLCHARSHPTFRSVLLRTPKQRIT